MTTNILPAQWSLWLLALTLWGLVFAGQGWAEQRQPNILILNSYHQGENWSDNEIAGLLSALRTRRPHLVPRIELIDAKHFPTPAHLDFFKGYLVHKYHGRTFDLIIALDNPALDLLVGNANDLFPETPVVFAGINGYRPEMIAGRKKVTGVVQRLDAAGTLEMALSMHPGAAKVLVIHDYTASGLAVRQETEQSLARFADKVELRYASDGPVETLSQELRAMPQNGLVLLLTYVTDKAGRTFTREESARLIAAVSPAPVYTVHATDLGFGVVGGLLLEGQEHGRQAADLALRVLGGADSEHTAIEESRSRCMIDYTVATKLQITERLWPDSALVVNRPISFWNRHRSALIPSFAAILVLTALSLLLWVTVIRLRRTKQTIHKSEEKYRVLFSNIPLGITVTNRLGKIIETNDMAAKLLGLSKEDHEARTLDSAEWRIIRPDGTPMPVDEYAGMRALHENAVIEHVEMGIVRPNAETIWLSVAAAPLHLEDYGVMVIYSDVSERKQAEKALLRKDALLGAMLRNLPFDFWARDANQRILMQSDESVNLWGDLAADTASLQQFDAKTLEQGAANNRRVLAGEIISEECALVTKDGGLREFHHILAPIREGTEILGVLGINIDITEHKQVLEEVCRSNELLSSFIKHSPIYAYIKEVAPFESRVLKASDNFQEMIGVPGSQMAGKTMEELFPAEFAAKITADDWLVVSRGEILHQDEELNGRCYTTFKFPIPIGRKSYLAGYTIDLTERRRAAEEKSKLEAQLAQAQKMESVGRLAGGVAHDFNNMLGVILGQTELTMSRLEPTHPLFASLQNIHNAAERSADLTRQLLAFARKQTVVPKMLDLNEIVEGMLSMLRRLISEDINLVWLPGRNLGAIKMDPSQVDQILVNLCVNARDAISDAGVLTIETGIAVFDEAYCTAHPGFFPGEYVLLALSDNGSGMDAETISHLFEPFFTTKDFGKGTGLGLATVYGIVRQNNGFIDVDSAPGRGTTFRVYLPRHEIQAEQTAQTDAVELLARGRETILLVEDEPMILEMTKEMLEGQGYAVLPVAAPNEAISLSQEHAGKIDLLITDVVMPEMNGRELAAQLLLLRPDLQLLFMSGYTADVIAQHGVLEEGVHFIQKPFSLKDLSAKVRAVLDAGTMEMRRETA
jgi:PAS domain S-box-containing protein